MKKPSIHPRAASASEPQLKPRRPKGWRTEPMGLGSETIAPGDTITMMLVAPDLTEVLDVMIVSKFIESLLVVELQLGDEGGLPYGPVPAAMFAPRHVDSLSIGTIDKDKPKFTYAMVGEGDVVALHVQNISREPVAVSAGIVGRTFLY